MSFLHQYLPKEANNILTQCGTDGHMTLLLLHLKFNPIHFLFQTDKCKTIPIKGNKSFANYASDYNWYVVNRALILNQKNDINDEFTQDMFISNMTQCDDCPWHCCRRAPFTTWLHCKPIQGRKFHAFNCCITEHSSSHIKRQRSIVSWLKSNEFS